MGTLRRGVFKPHMVTVGDTVTVIGYGYVMTWSIY
jgi:hypothetical protein